MNKKMSPRDELDMDNIAEGELLRLQRQYRIMEGERQAYAEETNVILQKQRNIIESLEMEKQELQTRYNKITSKINEVKDNKYSETIDKLVDVKLKFEKKIKNEKIEITELENQIITLEKKISKLKKKDINDFDYIAQIKDESNFVSILENRLDVVTVRFNNILSDNSNLRKEIDHLLKERNRFNFLYEQMLNRLNSGKRIMVDLVDQANLAYEQREDSQNKLQNLRTREKNDDFAHRREIKKMQWTLEHETKLHEFLSTKGQRRILADLEAKEAMRKQSEKEAKDDLIINYQATLEQIRESCGESDIDRLSAHFLKQEEENFALFNYVSEQNSELESIEEEVARLESHLETQKEASRIRAQQQQDTVDQLQETLQLSTLEIDRVHLELHQSRLSLDTLLNAVRRLFDRLGCYNAPMLHLLEGEVLVTPYNVMLFLRIIDRQIEDFRMKLANEINKNKN